MPNDHFSTGKKIAFTGVMFLYINLVLTIFWILKPLKKSLFIGQYDGDVLRMMITSDGTIYTTSADHSIRVHKFSDGKLQKTLTGHQDWVYSLALDPSTKILATGDHRGHVQLWNTDDGQEILSFLAAPGVLNDEKTNP